MADKFIGWLGNLRWIGEQDTSQENPFVVTHMGDPVTINGIQVTNGA